MKLTIHTLNAAAVSSGRTPRLGGCDGISANIIKWMEAFPMTSTTANATIEVLRALFARYGLPHELVSSDNGPQFVAGEFKSFLKMNCIKHTLCLPYHPSTNGLAERHVQTFKAMYQSCTDKGSVQHRVSNVLFRYRNTPGTPQQRRILHTVFEERTQDTPLLGETQFTKACRKETSCFKIIQGWAVTS